MEPVETIPYLLGKDQLKEGSLTKFNNLKKKENPDFVPLKYVFQISTRPEVRADKLWSSVVPKEKEGMSCSTTRYVLVPLDMAPYVIIHEYDGTETYSIDYNKYGIKKIQEILVSTSDTDKISAIQDVIDKVVRETNK